MRKFSIAGGVLAAALLSTTAFAQAPAPAPKAPPAAAAKTEVVPKLASPHWRSSKMIGLRIYNEQNERLGDINEILLDSGGKVMGYVVGVGGFLGMGEHDIFVEPGKIKFVNEPVRTSAAPTAPSKTAEPMATRPASNPSPGTTAARATTEMWYPDHGVLSASKDQLKAMPQFKYSNYN